MLCSNHDEHRLEVSLKGYKVAKNLNAEIGKVILYGPNAAGKTTLMEAIAYLLTIEGNEIAGRKLISFDDIRSDFELSVSRDQEIIIKLNYEKGKYKLVTLDVKNHKYEYSEYIKLDDTQLKASIRGSLARAGFNIGERVAWIDTCALYISGMGGGYNYHAAEHGRYALLPLSISELKKVVSSMDAVDKLICKLEHDAYYLLGISKIYFDDSEMRYYVKKEGAVMPYDSLSYGERKALAIVTAARLADSIFVEAFEAGLHGDLIEALIDYLDRLIEKGVIKAAILETHLGAAVGAALARGWKAYYIEDGETKKEIASIDDLRDVTLYKKELELLRVPS